MFGFLLTLPVWFIHEFGLETSVLMLGVIGVYSLLPDIDIGTSKIHKTFVGVGIAAIMVAVYLDLKELVYLVGLGLLGMVFLLKHRGITHSILAAVIFSTPLYIVYDEYVMGVGLTAYISHLIADKKIRLR